MKKIKEMLRKIGTAGLAAIMLTAQEKRAEESVESERGDDKQVAASNTYDFKVLDKDGKTVYGLSLLIKHLAQKSG